MCPGQNPTQYSGLLPLLPWGWVAHQFWPQSQLCRREIHYSLGIDLNQCPCNLVTTLFSIQIGCELLLGKEYCGRLVLPGPWSKERQIGKKHIFSVELTGVCSISYMMDTLKWHIKQSYGLKKKLLVLAKSNNVHSWLFWLKKIKKEVWKIQSNG